MVSSERRHALRDLLEAALNCEPAIRETFVREASHGDEELSKEALWLLEQIHAKHSEPGTQHLTESQALDHVLRDSSEIETAAYTETVSSEEFRGTERFDVRRKLGSGGFGTVY